MFLLRSSERIGQPPERWQPGWLFALVALREFAGDRFGALPQRF
jgi:hypothetical protein